MTNLIITCNSGSSNTKLAVFEMNCHPRENGDLNIDGREIPAYAGMTKKEAYTNYNEAETINWLSNIPKENISAIGHRVVHGGDKFISPVTITPKVMKELEEFIPLAPLHQPVALKLISEVTKLYPHIPQVACFDTAFHHTIPEIERHLPLPQSYYADGIKRYGFHGLSYEYIASKLPDHLGAKATGRVIIAHLGNGSSMCALKNLKSVASTMGFSTLDGLMMGTRCGTLDVGVILHLIQHKNMSIDEINHLLYKDSGLLGVSGVSSDMRELLSSDKQEAAFAVDMYCYLAARQLSGLLPAIGGIDALVFTGGIGEHAEIIRGKICNHLKWLGDFPIYVIPTDEELVIAKACQALV